jgi:hypothetical protein
LEIQITGEETVVDLSRDVQAAIRYSVRNSTAQHLVSTSGPGSGLSKEYVKMTRHGSLKDFISP